MKTITFDNIPNNYLTEISDLEELVKELKLAYQSSINRIDELENEFRQSLAQEVENTIGYVEYKINKVLSDKYLKEHHIMQEFQMIKNTVKQTANSITYLEN